MNVIGMDIHISSPKRLITCAHITKLKLITT
jgi:hypothetical protein